MSIHNKAMLKVGGTNLQTYMRTFAYNEEAEELDDTAMGDDTRTSAGGLIRWTIEAEFNQAYGTGTPDAVFATLVGKTAAMVWKHSTTGTATGGSTSFPVYSGTGLITAYGPIQGAVGEQKVTSVSIVSAGSRTRAVT